MADQRRGLFVKGKVQQNGITTYRSLLVDATETPEAARSDFYGLTPAQILALPQTTPPLPSGGRPWTIVGTNTATNGFQTLKSSDATRLKLRVTSIDSAKGCFYVENEINTPDNNGRYDKPWQYHICGMFYDLSELPLIPFVLNRMHNIDMWQVDPNETDQNGRRAHSITYNPPQQKFTYLT